MPGVSRRSKPLKARTSLAEVTDFSVSNPSDGDLLVYDGDAGIWTNLKTLTGNYSIDGGLTLTALTATGGATISGGAALSGGLTVAGASVLSSTLSVAGATTLAAASLSGNLTVSGSATLAGALTGAGFSFSGAGTVAGDLTVSGLLTAGSLALDDISVDDITATGNIVLSGTGYFGGDVEMGGNLIVSGSVGGSYLGSSGNAGVSGDFEALGTSQLGDFLEISSTIDPDTLVAAADIYANRYSGVLTIRGERLDTPGDDDNAPVTTTVTMATLDPDGRVVLHYQGTDTFRTALNAVEFWNGSSWQELVSIPDGSNNYYPYTWNANTSVWEPRTPQVWFLLDTDLNFTLDDDDNVILDEPPADA